MNNMNFAGDYKPIISSEETIKLVKKLYGVKCARITELNAYDDKNYKIIAEHVIKNEYLPEICPDGYVLKITNSLESKKRSHLDAQIKMLLFLGQKGFKCPVPVRNVNGGMYSVENIAGHSHVIRLLEFQPGTCFYEVPIDARLLFQVGEYICTLDEALKQFDHPAMKTHTSIWKMNAIPEMKNYFYVIDDPARLALIGEIVNVFEREVLSRVDALESGVIHGDFNEQNIVVDKQDSDGWNISAVLDFGDINYSCYLFELAITLTYAMLQTKDIDSGGFVIAGYSSVRSIPPLEYSLLKISIAGRLAQSLVLGMYAHLRDPSNAYVATTQANGWKFLETFWEVPQDKLLARWTEISEEYLAAKARS